MKSVSSMLKKILLQPFPYQIGNALTGHFATIFMLHRSKQFTPSGQGTDPEVLKRCLDFATKRGFDFASIDELVHAALRGERLAKPTLCFTLDDGYKDQAEILIPILLDYNTKPTIFVIRDFVNNVSWPWDAKLAYLLADDLTEDRELFISGHSILICGNDIESRLKSRRFITHLFKKMKAEDADSQLQEISIALNRKIPINAPDTFLPASWNELNFHCKRGLIIGSHGSDHHTLSQLSEEQNSLSLQETRNYVSENAQNASNVFCYPSGTLTDFSDKHYKAVKTAGYLAAVSALPGNVKPRHITDSPFNIPRHAFPSTFEEFVQHTSWIEYCRTQRA